MGFMGNRREKNPVSAVFYHTGDNKGQGGLIKGERHGLSAFFNSRNVLVVYENNRAPLLPPLAKARIDMF